MPPWNNSTEIFRSMRAKANPSSTRHRIAILTMLVSRYKITVKEEAQFAHETFEERKARILTAKPGLTLT